MTYRIKCVCWLQSAIPTVDSVQALVQGNVTAEDVTIDMRTPVPLKPA